MQLIKIPKARKIYLDVVKLMAILMVVFNHSGNNGYKMYLEIMDAPAHQLIMAFSSFIKMAVPLFFMASGALLLRKDEPYKKTLSRALRFFLILLAVSAFFYYEKFGKGGSLSVKDFLIHLYKNDLTGHLWYLYSYICYLLMLPFLRGLVKVMKKRDYFLLALFFQAAQLLPVLDYALFRGSGAHTGYLHFFTAQAYVVYPLLGYYLDQQTEENRQEEVFYGLIFLSFVFLLFTCLLMDWRYAVDNGWTNSNMEAYMSTFTLIPAATLFWGIKRLFANRNLKERTGKVLFVLASCTFGVYLFDPKWRQFTQSIRSLLSPALGVYFATHVQTFCACLLGMAATFLFKCAAGGMKLMAGRITCKQKQPE